ncbi:hypothetical protein ACI79C_22825 [Geodermatophilus sp. SYSU D00697]
METRTTRHGRISSGVLAGALLLMPIAACGDSTEPAEVDATPDVTATETAAPEETDGGADVTVPEDTAATPEPGGTDGTTDQTDGTDADVDCSGNSCSVTLSGDGAEADVLGTRVVLGGVEDGRATVRVGDQDLSCGQGESVSAGPLTLACSTVTEDTVTLTASLG